MKILKIFLLTLFAIITLFPQAQRVTGRGDIKARRVGTHDGNLVHTVFTNYGVIAQPGNLTPRGAWKGDNNGYVGDVSPLVGLLLPPYIYNDTTGITHIDTFHTVIITPVDRPGGGKGPGSKFWGFEPIGGFFNPAVDKLGRGVAMSHQPDTWPSSWPDQPNFSFSEKPIYDPSTKNYITPLVDWNGYFGRGTGRIATQESYFWMDDNNDEKFTLQAMGFKPDSLDKTRSGKAIQMSVRGLQWGGDPVAQNCIFWLYNIKNDGTTNYAQAAFGCLVGTWVGGGYGDGATNPEWSDDASFFDVRQAITYTWDYGTYITPSSNPKWVPNPSAVGYIAYAFLESPGNGYDGIDNDLDNPGYLPSQANKFDSASFTPRTIKSNSDVVLIDPVTFKRSLFHIGKDTVTVYSMGKPFFIKPDVTQLSEGGIDKNGVVSEDAYDGIDNDLDGLIDENFNVHYRQFKRALDGTVLIDLVNAAQYIDYFTGIGSTDAMIDERRDDNIDNDRDWSRKTDDVGSDGKATTHDADGSEGNGIPNHGEPNFDETDVHESDQLGLTSFWYFTPAGQIKMSDDEFMWSHLKPGYYDVPSNIKNNEAQSGADGDFVYGAGYFPLLAGETQRFSLALAFGDDLKDVMRTKRVVQIIYNANYTFPSPPETPTLTAVPGDKKVTLYWDHVAEVSLDPIDKQMDFEGYKIYRSNVYDFTDIFDITDGTGKVAAYRPLKQFDLKNEYTGFFPLSPVLRDLYNGYSFYLGEDNGIQNSFVDTTVINGRQYFYGLTSYDRGRTDSLTFPRENTFSISRNSIGQYTFVKNTAMVVPNKPGVGYQPSPQGKATHVGGHATASVSFEVVDNKKVKTNNYYITFQDTLLPQAINLEKDTVWQGPFAKNFSVTDASGKVLLGGNKKIASLNGDVFDGIRLSFDTSFQSIKSMHLIDSLSRWKNPYHYKIDSNIVTGKKDTVKVPALVYYVNYVADSISTPHFYGKKFSPDYEIVFSDKYADSSNDLSSIYDLLSFFPVSTKLNFQVWDVTDKNNRKRAKFHLLEPNTGMTDTLSDGDLLVLSDDSGKNILWEIGFNGSISSYIPTKGDTLFLNFARPLSSKDTFLVKTVAASNSADSAKKYLAAIKAVPNPYVVTNMFEPTPAAGLQGRGDRVIMFTNVPPNAKINIYTSSGNHVRSLEQSGSIFDGSVKWDLRSKEGLEVAFGVYFYVVELDGISEKKTGKLAIIK